MKKQILTYCTLLVSYVIFAQAGHIMQGVGAVNMSMGGASTAQPLDINGALHWNPASISVFDGKEISLSVGAFFSDPTLNSTVPEFDEFGIPTGNFFSGITEDDRDTSILPALAFVWGKEDSKHTFGVSAFGISGFGVTFPESTTNPINTPQPNGFGLVESDYSLLQVSLTYAYQLSTKVSIGLQPNINYATLELAPNPLAIPDPAIGSYPNSDKATAIGFGGQIGVFYDSGKLLKLGVSYKTKQEFADFGFKNTNQDGSSAADVDFQMNYPAIWSIGMGLSGKKIDFALDFRYVDYDSTEGFSKDGWQINDDSTSPFFGFPTGAVNGFGWESMTIVSTGLQYKIKDNFPIRIGYTHSSPVITSELTFFSIPATAVIEDAAQIGFGYQISDKFKIDAVYHQGFRGRGIEGKLLNPRFISEENPLGEIPRSAVSYDMETSMIQFTFSYKLN